MATLYENDELKSLIQILSWFYCNSLGLNEHFPRCILYGPSDLEGMGLPCLQTALTVIRVSYFFYHTRQQTQVGHKLEISIANMQLESGIDVQVFLASYSDYGHLVTKSMVKCIWGEMSPYGMSICGHSSVLWVLKPQGNNDFALVAYAVRHLNKVDAIQINLCRIYLRVIMHMTYRHTTAPAYIQKS